MLRIHNHFLVFSHQGTFPRLSSGSAPDNLGWNSINSDPVQAPDASQTFSPRNLLQGRQTWSAPGFGFLFQVRVCVKRQIVFSPSVVCGICSNALNGRMLGRYDCGLCSCLDVSELTRKRKHVRGWLVGSNFVTKDLYSYFRLAPGMLCVRRG